MNLKHGALTNPSSYDGFKNFFRIYFFFSWVLYLFTQCLIHISCASAVSTDIVSRCAVEDRAVPDLIEVPPGGKVDLKQ